MENPGIHQAIEQGLKRSYEWFKFLYNTFTINLNSISLDNFIELLDSHYSTFPLSQVYLNGLSSIYFMPLDGVLFSKLLSLIHDISFSLE